MSKRTKPPQPRGQIFMSSFEMTITRNGVTQVVKSEQINRRLIDGDWVDVGADGRPLVKRVTSKVVKSKEVERP